MAESLDAQFKQACMDETIQLHPEKGDRTWYTRVSTPVSGGFDNVDTEIIAKLSPLTDKEASLHGQTVQDGDMKLLVSGQLELTTKSVVMSLTSDDIQEEWDVFKVIKQTYGGLITEQRLFIRPKGKKVQL